MRSRGNRRSSATSFFFRESSEKSGSASATRIVWPRATRGRGESGGKGRSWGMRSSGAATTSRAIGFSAMAGTYPADAPSLQIDGLQVLHGGALEDGTVIPEARPVAWAVPGGFGRVPAHGATEVRAGETHAMEY